MPEPRKKVAILGGGVGAMTTALYLTNPEHRDRYEVTVYQMGWRIGGKGASGRNPDAHQRIEEHGIHIWSGLYDNAFRHMRQAYAELGRPAGTPLATWRDAFKPVPVLSMMESYGGDWLPWTSISPTNDQLPGDPDAKLFLPFWSYVGEGIQLVRRWFRDAQRGKRAHDKETRGFLGRIFSALAQAFVVTLIEVMGAVAQILYAVFRVAHTVVDAVAPRAVLRLFHAAAHFMGGVLVRVVAFFTWLHWLRVKNHMDHTEVRRGWVSLNVAVGILKGIHADDIVRRGFDSVDHVDFREWLSRHIVDDGLTLDSPMSLFLYDADFAYEGGSKANPRLSAGVALYSLFRLGLTYKGSSIWEMQAGMGDTVFTPFYEVLRNRGVTFRFFSKVKALHLDEEAKSIASITVARQARVKDGEDRYRPLVSVEGLDCWPSCPHWGQLEGGEALKAAGVDFEQWCGPELEEYDLLAGRDFDQVVLGISLGGIPYVCQELIEADDRWRAMVQNVGTVRTLAAQFWFKDTTAGLGWNLKHGSASSTYDASQFDSWCDMSHLLGRESWPADPARRPGSIGYICGPLPEEDAPRGRRQSCPELDQEGPEADVKARTTSYLEHQAYRIYADAAGPDHFDWDRLLVPEDGVPGKGVSGGVEPEGPARLDAQYIRANVQPTERYVLSLPGTTRHRLHPGDSRFANLVLAGDWTWNSFNAGCVEAASISGMLAAHALCGSPALDTIVGLTFGHVGTPYDGVK